VPPSRYASFVIALPLYRVFEYRIDDSEPVVTGTRFRLPFGQGTRIGVALGESDKTDYDVERIKPIEARIDQQPVLDEHMLSLAKWMSEYYLQPLGEVIFQCLPGYLRGSRAYQSLRVKRWRLIDCETEAIEKLRRRSPRQFEIGQALLSQPGGMTAAQFKEINPNWHAVVKSMVGKGLLRWEWVDAMATPVIGDELPCLSDEQAAILNQVEPRLKHFAVHLMDGVTGSGKTEIYLRLIQARIADGLQVIYLVPEIGLTNQLIDRVRQRFGDCFATSHSGLTEYQRYQAWDRFRRGEVSIMLGTRSTLFSQSDRLGMIVIDEEHDHSYRQQDGVRYHARDVAIKRAQMLDIPVVLGSATAALESIANCERDTWFRYRIDHRPTRYPPPPIQLIDVRNRRFEFGLAAPTFARIDSHLENSGQVLVYLNRRGFAPVVMCHECGWQAQCRNCDARLTLHHSLQTLLCHHCGFGQAIPGTCPDCGHDEVKHYGIGTEQLEQGLRSRYPDTPVLRVDRDVISSRDALRQRLQQLQDGEPCILIGTQMIAKGHDYPAITLSVVLDADQALFSASYRASESLVQTLFQVCGRSGRGDRAGEALVQTRFSDHPMMQALLRKDYREIAADLLQERRLLGFPPYARVVMFRADALELKQALAKLEEIKALLGQARHFGRLASIGPIAALMTRRIGRYRAQLCLLSADFQSLRSVLSEAMPAIQEIASNPRVSWSVDVDAPDL
jgi:primosomal protein N' (replication factor Y)